MHVTIRDTTGILTIHVVKDIEHARIYWERDGEEGEAAREREEERERERKREGEGGEGRERKKGREIRVGEREREREGGRESPHTHAPHHLQTVGDFCERSAGGILK